jgi:subtilisin-like proprotein convertase family protein
VGDLRVELEAPSGKRAVLRNREGGGANDIRDSLEVAALVGEEVAGEWTLHVMDLAGRDVGRLDHWGIEVGWAPVGRVFEKHVKVDLPIPDDDPDGVSSAIFVEGPGTVRAMEISVDIEHTFVGDLRVELAAPSGRVVVLHDRAGGALTDLRATWTSSGHAGLAGMVGDGRGVGVACEGLGSGDWDQ